MKKQSEKEELGLIAENYHIHVKPGAKDVIHAPRKVPASLRETLKKELDMCERLGVISKVNKPTEWVNSLVIVPKANGKLRICMDPIQKTPTKL